MKYWGYIIYPRTHLLRLLITTVERLPGQIRCAQNNVNSWMKRIDYRHRIPKNDKPRDPVKRKEFGKNTEGDRKVCLCTKKRNAAIKVKSEKKKIAAEIANRSITPRKV